MGLSLIMLAQAASTTGDVTQEYLRAGLLGGAVVVLAVALVVLWRESKADATRWQETLAALHDRRVSDAQAVAAQLLRTTEQCVTALTTAAVSADTQRDALQELKGALEKLAEEIRTQRRAPR